MSKYAPTIDSKPSGEVRAAVDSYEVRAQRCVRAARPAPWRGAMRAAARARRLRALRRPRRSTGAGGAASGIERLGHATGAGAAAECAAPARTQKYHSAFGGDVDARKKEYADMVNKYYDLATSFYEYGALRRPLARAAPAPAILGRQPRIRAARRPRRALRASVSCLAMGAPLTPPRVA
jgi:hypothetical protein